MADYFIKILTIFLNPFHPSSQRILIEKAYYKLEEKRPMKILDTYHVHNEIHFAWLLKEIHLFIGNRILAKEFVDLGMKMVYDHAEEMAKSTKGKVNQEYINMNKELFKIN